ncbi:MAG: NUDIX domain-containing protein [Waddliaceae bacterium]
MNTTVILRKVYPLDINYLEGINATLKKWEIKEDEEAYGDLSKGTLNLFHDPQLSVIPRGKVEKGETAQQAAIREAFEESGISKLPNK